jgi:hypothetical protein
MADETAGDSVTGLRWTHKSLSKIQKALAEKGFCVSRPTVGRLLLESDYSLRVNHKSNAGKQSEGRDEQFGYIARWRKGFLRRNLPVISIDTKKVELVGKFKQAGCEWRKSKRRVNIYDFPKMACGKAIPYGIYDVGRNLGACRSGNLA